jgi:penicillin-binding protein 1A
MTPPRGRSRRELDAWPELGRAKRRRARNKQRRRKRGIVLGVLLVIPIMLLVAAAVGGTAEYRSASCNLDKLRPVAIGQNSFVYARDGSLLGAIPAEKNRTPVSRSQISPWMPKATVAIEDRRFYRHGGIDVEGVFRAAIADVRAGKVVQGGSTITQQLVRNLYIGAEPPKTLKRKINEACLAIKLSRAWQKDRILTAYMNQVFYGNHAYGIEAAAETYFSKSAKALTLGESALLAGLPQAPSVYDPFHRPDQALRRRDQVLRAMLTNGDITATEYARAKSDRALDLQPGRRYKRIREPYFFTFVEEQLQKEYGTNTVRSGGLKVYTTIDPRLQRAATSAIKRVLYYKDDPSAAIVAIDPRNGAIRAMTAVTPGRKNNKFNLVSQAQRQPGSTFKTVALTTAISLGINPDSTYYLSAPLRYSPDPSGSCYTDPPTAWCVQTYDHTYLGSTSLTNATVHSDNTVYARLSLDVGPERIAKMAYRLGVRETRLCGDCPSIALGSNSVSPLEMASVYATLAGGGVYSKPIAILKVVLPNGKPDKSAGWGRPQRERVIPDWVAYEATQVLKDNMLHGTGRGAYFGRISAGKTGTTDNYADAWFCGYVPQLEATVWVGYPRAEIPMLSVHGIAVSGPTFPAQIWHYFMDAAVGQLEERDFPQPRSEPHWVSWRGQYQYGGSSGANYGPSSYGSGSSGSSGSTTPGQPATTSTAPAAQAPAPETVAPPPADTAPPPSGEPAPGYTTPP